MTACGRRPAISMNATFSISGGESPPSGSTPSPGLSGQDSCLCLTDFLWCWACVDNVVRIKNSAMAALVLFVNIQTAPFLRFIAECKSRLSAEIPLGLQNGMILHEL